MQPAAALQEDFKLAARHPDGKARVALAGEVAGTARPLYKSRLSRTGSATPADKAWAEWDDEQSLDPGAQPAASEASLDFSLESQEAHSVSLRCREQPGGVAACLDISSGSSNASRCSFEQAAASGMVWDALRDAQQMLMAAREAQHLGEAKAGVVQIELEAQREAHRRRAEYAEKAYNDLLASSQAREAEHTAEKQLQDERHSEQHLGEANAGVVQIALEARSEAHRKRAEDAEKAYNDLLVTSQAREAVHIAREAEQDAREAEQIALEAQSEANLKRAEDAEKAYTSLLNTSQAREAEQDARDVLQDAREAEQVCRHVALKAELDANVRKAANSEAAYNNLMTNHAEQQANNKKLAVERKQLERYNETLLTANMTLKAESQAQKKASESRARMWKVERDQMAKDRYQYQDDAVHQQAAHARLVADHAALSVVNIKTASDLAGLHKQHKELMDISEELKSFNDKLMRQKAVLETELDIAHGVEPRFRIDALSAGGRALRFLDELLDGKPPSLTDVMTLRETIRVSKELWKPTQNLEAELASQQLEEEVVRNLVGMLGDSEKTTMQLDDTPGPGTPLARMVQRRNSNCSSSSECSYGSAAELINLTLVDPRAVSPILEVEQVLQSSKMWCWDAFQLNVATQDHALSTLAFYLFRETGLTQEFKLNEVKLARFFRKIEQGYPDNPYHNRTHAADVLQTMHKMLTEGGLYPNYADRTGMLSAMLAAVVHDFEHSGFTNDFLVHTAHSYAMTYNDRAPQENHHLAASFMLMARDECNFLEHVPKTTRAILRKQIIEMVLATDMKNHFNIVAQFQSKLQAADGSARHTSTPGGGSLKSEPGATFPAHDKALHGSSQTQPAHAGSANVTINEKPACICMDDEERSIALQTALKVADISHLACSFSVHETWLRRLEEEFFKQGDAELLNKLPVSPLMNRTKAGISKSQVGFFDIVALPMFKAFVRVFPDNSPLLFALLANYQAWREVETTGVISAATATAAEEAAAEHAHPRDSRASRASSPEPVPAVGPPPEPEGYEDVTPTGHDMIGEQH
ncbi:hypothetical protein WJX72_000962 [[Myrmecia] bisecta]|uniref:Phosphodiesterase n=1 Tax=[Myrmecia] bisecta TaxID=41462 RepID=A0AAW1Q1E1_9CHLO